MLCSAQNPKLNKQFASGFAVASLFPFLRNELFPLRGKVFFLPVFGRLTLKNNTTGGNRDAADERCEHRRKTA